MFSLKLIPYTQVNTDSWKTVLVVQSALVGFGLV